MKKITLLAWAIASLAYGVSAQAASSASASISDITFTLIDLAPNDGSTPWFSINSAKGSTSFSLSATDNALGESDSATVTRQGTFKLSMDQLYALTNTQVQGSITDKSLSVSGAAYGPQTSYNASVSTGVSGSYYPYYSQPLNLSLSANSVLLIDAKVDLAASATNPSACTYYYYCGTSESASASASSSLSYNYSMGGVNDSASSNQTLNLQATATGATSIQEGYVYDPTLGYYVWKSVNQPAIEQNKVLSQTLHNVFSNVSSSVQLANLGFSVSVSGIASTVPEPGSYALMLEGLLVGGLILRRQRQRR
jgi:hypothetical protein